MAKVRYMNKQTGKSFTADEKDVAILKQNPVLASAFTFEAPEAKPKEISTTKPADETTSPAKS